MTQRTWTRRAVLAGAAALSAWRPQRAAAAEPKVEDGVAWYDVSSWGVEGRGWSDVARYFDRLPARAEEIVRKPVWELSRHSSGMLARFEADAPVISARYKLTAERLAMPHMPATGVSGLDLYARDERGRDYWLGVARPQSQQVEAELAKDIDPRITGERLYTVYLPLYNGIESLEVGVPEDSAFRPVAPRAAKPIVFYGTSIMQGGCASRPGMSISGIVGRRLGLPAVNLGFSGNGRMESALGELLSELDPAVYVIDCLPNMTGEMVAERAAPLARQLRAARPETPILLVEDRTDADAWLYEHRRDRHRARRTALRAAYEALRSDGVAGLHYLAGDGLLGLDGEATTDGSHPNDLGMMRYADAYEKVLRRILDL